MKSLAQSVALALLTLCIALAPAAQAGGLHYGARWNSSNESQIEMPDITAASRGREDESLSVKGLRGSGTTDLVVMNLGQSAASCWASVTRADGTFAIAPVEISVPALGQRVFADVLRGLQRIDLAQAEVACSNEFYAYAQRIDEATGQVTVIGASRSEGTLDALFKGGFAADRPCVTGAGRALCEEPGLSHTPSKSKAALFIGMTPPPDTYKILRAHVDVKVNTFNPINQGGAHGIIWLIINNNKKLVGSVFLRGAGKNNVTLRHGVCSGVCLKTKVEKPIPLSIGSTYAFDYEYNTSTKQATMRASLNNQLVALIQDKTEVNNLFINPGDQVIIGLSNGDLKSKVEPPSLGWTYSNLRVELLK